MSFQELVGNVQTNVQSAFGEAIVFVPEGEEELELFGVFDETHLFVDPETESTVSSYRPTLSLKESDLPRGIEKGEVFRIREERYRVSDSQRDGRGWIEFILYRI